MVQYLVSNCGLKPAAAAKAAPLFANLDSTSRPDAVLAFLRSQGLTRRQVRRIVSRKPELLLRDVDATLEPKFRAIRALGLGRADAARLFALYPPALTFGVQTKLLPRVLFWLDYLGSAKLLIKWLAKTWLLQYGVDIFFRNLSTLRSIGIPESRILATSEAKLQKLLDRVEGLRVPPSSGMFMWVLYTLHNVSESAFRAKKAAVMSAAGCTEEEFAAMCRRAPCFMFAPAELLRQKVEFLLGKAECDARYIVNNPVLLTFSLSKRMVPRHRVIETLRSRGVDIGTKANLRGIMRSTEAMFVDRYIVRYQEQVPELHELYPPRQVNGKEELAVKAR
uniref:Uncharacterized protein n=1 Tax=Oryza brachyantha TaxID=4533 RepID=J3M1T7_ORYBR